MATTTSIHMYDAGVQFLISVVDSSGPVSLLTVQNVTLFLQAPNRSVSSYVCSVVDANAGIVSYVSGVSDFNQAGRWLMQLVVRFADDNIKHSDIGSFTVLKNLS